MRHNARMSDARARGSGVSNFNFVGTVLPFVPTADRAEELRAVTQPSGKIEI
jgi:hypothetical protein